MQAQGGESHEHLIAVARERARLVAGSVRVCVASAAFVVAVECLMGLLVSRHGLYKALSVAGSLGAYGAWLAVYIPVCRSCRRLATALDLPDAWLYIWTLRGIPVLCRRATALLREAGMEVGFWGPSERQIAAWTGPPA